MCVCVWYVKILHWFKLLSIHSTACHRYTCIRVTSNIQTLFKRHYSHIYCLDEILLNPLTHTHTCVYNVINFCIEWKVPCYWCKIEYCLKLIVVGSAVAAWHCDSDETIVIVMMTHKKCFLQYCLSEWDWVCIWKCKAKNINWKFNLLRNVLRDVPIALIFV